MPFRSNTLGLIFKRLPLITIILIISSISLRYCEFEQSEVEYNDHIIGSWGSGHFDDMDMINAEYASITFYPNNFYILWESDCGGVEYGTYSYDPDSKKLSVSAIVDENDVCGFADNGTDRNWRIRFSKDWQSANFHLESENTSVKLKRVQDDGSKLVGSWGPGHFNDLRIINAEFASITFYPNNYYILWESGCNGVEYGKYSYSQNSKKLRVHNLNDENGKCGFADEGQDRHWFIDINDQGDVATVSIKKLGKFIFEKVKR